MPARLFVQRLTNQKAESGKLKVVEFSVRGKEKRRVASAEAVRKFRKREAVAEEVEGDMGVVERGKKVEDIGDFLDSLVDDATRECDVANRRPEEVISITLGPWNSAI